MHHAGALFVTKEALLAALLKGDKHPAVATLQEALNRLGATPRLAVDSDFGDHTKLAVRRFQESQPKFTCAYGGIAGSETLDRLGIRIEVEKLVIKLPLLHKSSENWAASLGVRSIMYSEMGYRNSDPGQVLDFRTYVGTGFQLHGYDALVGGRITVTANGVYTFHGPDDPDRVTVHKNECAALVQAFGLPHTKFWRKGPRVIDANPLPGTVVATMRDDQYYSDHTGRSHVAILLSKDGRQMRTLDQWNNADIHVVSRKFKPEDTGEQRPFPLNKDEGPFGWTSDADEYYIVYSAARCSPRNYQ